MLGIKLLCKTLLLWTHLMVLVVLLSAQLVDETVLMKVIS